MNSLLELGRLLLLFSMFVILDKRMRSRHSRFLPYLKVKVQWALQEKIVHEGIFLFSIFYNPFETGFCPQETRNNPGEIASVYLNVDDFILSLQIEN